MSTEHRETLPPEDDGTMRIGTAVPCARCGCLVHLTDASVLHYCLPPGPLTPYEDDDA